MAINSIGGVSDNILEGPFGSDKSIQYNNNGVWAGSTSLVWDSNNTRLGVGITTPLEALDVNGVIQANSSIKTVVGSGVQAELILEQNTVATWEIYNPASSTDLLLKNTTDLFTFTSSGRLGIGVTNPNRPLHIQGNVSAGNVSVDFENTNTGGAAGLNLIAGNAGGVISMNGDTLTSVVGDTGNMVLGNYYTAGGSDTGAVVFISGGNVERMRLDKLGNLGIAVTPSSWSQGKAFEIGGAGNALWYSGTTGDVLLRSNVYYNSGDKYGADGFATQLKINNSGGFEFFTAPSGVADAAVTLTNRMTIYNDGNVGINQNIPVAKLHIEGDNYSISNGGGATDGLIFRGGTDGIGTYTNGLSFSYGAGSSAIAGVQDGVDNDSIGMVFFTHPSGTGLDDAQESMRITSSGNVGIGTNNPANQLTLFGGVGTQPSADPFGAQNSLWICQGGPDNAGISLTIDNDGGTEATLLLQMNASNDSGIIGTHGDNDLILRTNNNNRILIEKTTGNVGIGDNNPAYPLQVNGTIRATDGSDIVSLEIGTQAALFIRDAANYDGIIWPDVNGLNFRAADVASSPAMTIESSGNVGIGTDVPDTKLHISGSGNVAGKVVSTDASAVWVADSISTEASILSFTTSGVNAWKIQKAATTGNLEIRNSTDATKFTMLDNGNVGLGVIPNASWSSTYTVLQIGQDVALWGAPSGAAANLSSNLYYDGGGYRYLNSSRAASQIYMTGGQFGIQSAASGTAGQPASLATRLHMTNAGQFFINAGALATTDSTANLNIATGGSSGGIKLIAGFTPGNGNDLGTITFAGNDSANDNSIGEATITAKAAAAHNGTSAPTDLLFSTKPSSLGPGSSPVERMRILSSGGITFNGDTADANALDDYEEGTWVPTFTPSGSGSITLDSGGGAYYTKVGQLVTVTLSISVLSVSAPTGYVDISLPIAPNTSNYKGRSAVAVYVDALLAGNNTRDAIALVEDSSANIRVYQGDSNTNQADFAQAVTAGTYFNLTASYIAN